MLSIQDLKHRRPVIITISSLKSKFRNDDLPEKLLGMTFLAQRTGSHTVQPLLPFGQFSYNIYDEQLSELISLEHNRTEFLEKEKLIMPVRYSRDYKIWYKEGKVHRDDDLPAKIYANGTQVWYQRGEVMRSGFAPDWITGSGKMLWHKNGKCVSKEYMKFIKVNAPEYFI